MEERFDQNWRRIEEEIGSACAELAPELPHYEVLDEDEREQLKTDLRHAALAILHHCNRFDEGAASVIKPRIVGELTVFGDLLYELAVRREVTP